MSNSNKNALMVLFLLIGIGGFIMANMYIVKPKKEETSQIKSENETLRATRNELQEENNHKEEYEAEIKENTEFFYSQLEKFPGALNQDVAVMFMKNIQKLRGNVLFALDQVQLDRPELRYTVAAPANDEFGNTQYECYSAQYPTTYAGNYEGLKAVIDDVMAYPDRMNIIFFDIDYDVLNDAYTGRLNFDAYAVVGNGRPEEQADVDVKKGKNNPFLNGEGGSSIVSTSHDDDNGESIVSSHDVKIDIANANGDGSAGIVVNSGTDFISHSSNDEAVLDVKIEEKDGKVTVTYTLGDDDITSELTGNELDIYVSSSERVDSDDKNAVKVNVDNSTDVAVFIKVDGDDSSSPRFKLGSKTGTVKVY